MKNSIKLLGALLLVVGTVSVVSAQLPDPGMESSSFPCHATRQSCDGLTRP